MAQQWEWALAECQRRGAHLAFVRRVYQYARRGCKAAIVWHSIGQVQDTWFKGWHAPVGVYVVLHGDSGWDPHNANPNVFYVEPQGVFYVEPQGVIGGDC